VSSSSGALASTGVSSATSIARDSATTLFLRVALYAAGLVVAVLVSRVLGPSGRGEYYLLVVAAATLGSIARLGLEQANVYLYSAKSVPLAGLNAQNGLVTLSAGGLAAAAMIAVPFVAPRILDTDRTSLILAALTVPLNLHIILTGGLQTLAGQVTWQFKAGLAAALLQLGVLVVIAFMGALSVPGVLLVNLIATAAGLVVLVRAPGSRTLPALRFDRDLLVRTLRQSLVLHVGMVLFFLQLRIDTFLLGSLAGVASLGVYSLAVLMAETMFLVTDSLAIATLPKQLTNSVADAARLALRGVRVNVILGAAIAFGWVAAGPIFIHVLFGVDFGGAYPALVALLPGSIFLGMQRMCGPIILRSGTPFRLVRIYALALGVNVLLNLFWIPAAGITGAGLASSISYGVSAALILFWTTRAAGAGFVGSLVPRRADLLVLVQTAIRLGQVIGSVRRR
jgi:O-antigen/teichoic acid export membrane protein